MEIITAEAREALEAIVRGNGLMQIKYPAPIEKELIDAGMVQQTLGGTLRATDAGTAFVLTEKVAARTNIKRR